MAKYIINGGNKLSGKVKISGNKNSALPAIAASLLTDEDVILKNIPDIADVKVLVEILKFLGAKVSAKPNELKINTSKVKAKPLPKNLVTKLRASILLAGPLLARFGKVKFYHPGGDVIGKRNIDTHLSGFKSLGYKCHSGDQDYSIQGEKLSKDCSIFMEEASVTATENLLMCASVNTQKTILKNAAQEPQIVDLCKMLNAMGAKISGIGSQTLEIVGVKALSGTTFTISPDYIEMATYSIAASITGGEIVLENCSLENLEPILYPLEKIGLEFTEKDNRVYVKASRLKSLPKLVTNIWPGFPTDLMSAMIVLSTQSHGVSLMHDWMYESRMFFVDKLISMGANITIADPHRVFISGPTKLHGRNLETPDIRAGMSLVLAALVAKGESTINRAELIERGYEKVVENLKALGVQIQRVD